MSSLAAIRTGFWVGSACAIPVTVWLGPQVLDSPAAGAEAHTAMRVALGGLWVAQGIAITAAGPQAVGTSWTEGCAGLFALVAVPFPLLSVLWLAGAASARMLVTGIGLLWGYAAGVWAVGKLLHGARWIGDETRRTALAVVETAFAVGIWTLREQWLSWIGV